MPLLGRKPYVPPAPTVPEGIPDSDNVYVVRLTGEIFTDYDAYLEQLAHYRAAKWTCSVTGRGGLTFEQALLSEQEANQLLQQFPAELEGPFCGVVHHSTLRLEELVTHLADVSKSFKFTAPGGADTASGKPGKQAPLAKPVIKLWLHEAATWTGRYWSVKLALCTKYGLGGDLPEEAAPEEEEAEGQQQAVAAGRRGRGRAGSPVEGRRQAALRGMDAMAAAMLDDSPPSTKGGGPVRSKKKKPAAKSLEEEERAKPGTTKHAALQVLKSFCPYEGLSVEQVIKLSMDQGIKTDWPPGGKRNLYHVMHTDPAFLRVSRNTYVLTSVYPDRDEWIEEVKEKAEGRGKKPTKKELEAMDGGVGAAESEQHMGLVPLSGGGGLGAGGAAGGSIGVSGAPSPDDLFVMQRLEIHLQQTQSNLVACQTGVEMTQTMVAAARGRYAEAEAAQARLLAAHPQMAALQPEVVAAAARAVEAEQRQLAAVLGEADRAQRALDSAVRAAEEAEKALLRERIRQQSTVDGRAERERARAADKEDKERRRLEAVAAVAGRRFPIDDTELVAEAATRAAERGVAAGSVPDVFLTEPFQEEAGRRLADSLYLADLLFQLGGELGLRVVRYAHVDTLLLGGQNPLSVIAAAEQIIASKEYAEEAAAAAAAAAEAAAAAAAEASAIASGAMPPPRKDKKSKKIGGAAAAAAEASGGGTGANGEEAIVVDRVGDPTLLADLYVQLLKNLLMDVWESSAMTRWERRWLEGLDEGTWAEVLRRYTIVRAGAANREPLSAAAVAALGSLGRDDPEALAGGEHIALLLLLSEDLMEMERMRNWMQRRLDYSTSVAAGLRADIAEDRKKLRELAGAEKEAKKRKRDGPDESAAARAAAAAGAGAPAAAAPTAAAASGKRIKLSGAAAAAAAAHVAAAAAAGGGEDGGEAEEEEEPVEPSWELPEELREFTGDTADRRAVASFRTRLQAAKQRIERSRAQWHADQKRRNKERDLRRRHLEPIEQRVAREKREAEEALVARQEALERELDRCNIRRAPLGTDRHHRRYWWGLAGLKSLVLVEHSDGVWSAIATPEQLEALIYSLDMRGVRESELRKALERSQPAILAAMSKVRRLLHSGEAEAAATSAREEAVDAMEGYGLDGDELGGGALMSGPYRGASMRQLVDSVAAMTTAAEAEDVPGPARGWRDWRERLIAVAETGELDAEWEAEDAAEAEAASGGAEAGGAEAEAQGQQGPEPELQRVYAQLSRRLLQLQRWFFAHSGQEGHPRFTENMPAPGGVSAAAAKAGAGAGAGGAEGQPGATPGLGEDGGAGAGAGGEGGGSSDTEGEDDGDETRGLSEAPQDGEEDGEDERRRKDRMRRRGQSEVMVPDDSPELVDRDLTRDEEKSRSSNGFCRHFMWRSKKEQASWVGMADKAATAPRLAFCATSLAFHSAGLLGVTLKWAKKPKKH